jgi:hypothetical protein
MDLSDLAVHVRAGRPGVMREVLGDGRSMRAATAVGEELRELTDASGVITGGQSGDGTGEYEGGGDDDSHERLSHGIAPLHAGRVRQWLDAVPGGHGCGPRVNASRLRSIIRARQAGKREVAALPTCRTVLLA